MWRDRIRWATLDLSGPYRNVFDTMLPDAVQVADPFNVVKLAATCVDEVRRRVQNDTYGHRGRKDDPLYRARRLLLMADERLDHKAQAKVCGLLAAGDPKNGVYELVARCRAEGDTAFEPRSKRPSSSPPKLDEATASLIVAVRDDLARRGHDAGLSTICWHLEQHQQVVVSPATVYR